MQPHLTLILWHVDFAWRDSLPDIYPSKQKCHEMLSGTNDAHYILKNLSKILTHLNNLAIFFKNQII